MEDRIVIPDILRDDKEEKKIRPSTLDEFIGQENLKEFLRISIQAAKKRNEPLDHILLSGPPGLGKTTLANILANEMNVDIKSTSGPAVEKIEDLITILTSLEKGDILFIDEVHRLRHIMEEILYPAMEDFVLDVTIDQGGERKFIKLNLEPFTLIGATTRSGLLDAPFRDRFGFLARLDLYSTTELLHVIYRSASIFDCHITSDGALEIANRSRYTPRIANRLLRRVRDYAIVKGKGDIDKKMAEDALARLGIDRLGLDNIDKRILNIIAKDFGGGPVGIKTISISIGEEIKTIEEVYEPYLIQIGFIKRTSQGRETTLKAYEHLGILKPGIKTEDNKLIDNGKVGNVPLISIESEISEIPDDIKYVKYYEKILPIKDEIKNAIKQSRSKELSIFIEDVKKEWLGGLFGHKDLTVYNAIKTVLGYFGLIVKLGTYRGKKVLKISEEL